MKNQNDKTTIAHDCTWACFDDEPDYETDCSNYFEDLEVMGLEACGFVYCPFCGRKIIWEAVEGVIIL